MLICSFSNLKRGDEIVNNENKLGILRGVAFFSKQVLMRSDWASQWIEVVGVWILDCQAPALSSQFGQCVLDWCGGGGGCVLRLAAPHISYRSRKKNARKSRGEQIRCDVVLCLSTTNYLGKQVLLQWQNEYDNILRSHSKHRCCLVPNTTVILWREYWFSSVCPSEGISFQIYSICSPSFI